MSDEIAALIAERDRLEKALYLANGGIELEQQRVAHLTETVARREETIGRLRDENAALVKALREIGDWFGVTKSPLDQWEDLAEEFRRETGFLRPGKDYGAMGALTEEQEAARGAAWKTWSEARAKTMRKNVKAALAPTAASETGDKGERE